MKGRAQPLRLHPLSAMLWMEGAAAAIDEARWLTRTGGADPPPPLSPSEFSQGCPMHPSARLRVPLAGFALCSTALLISACGSSSGSDGKKVPTTAVAVVGTETVPKAKLDTLMTQVCVQYKAAKKACPKPG